MKAKYLIALLQNADPEMDVCIFSDTGIDALSSDGSAVAVFEGDYRGDMLPKLAPTFKSGRYIGLGHPGDFDYCAPDDVVHWVKDLE